MRPNDKRSVGGDRRFFSLQKSRYASRDLLPFFRIFCISNTSLRRSVLFKSCFVFPLLGFPPFSLYHISLRLSSAYQVFFTSALIFCIFAQEKRVVLCAEQPKKARNPRLSGAEKNSSLNVSKRTQSRKRKHDGDRRTDNWQAKVPDPKKHRL